MSSNSNLSKLVNNKIKKVLSNNITIKSNKLVNNNTIAGYKIDADPFQYPITLGIIIIISLILVGYAFYKYYSDDDTFKIGKSYYGPDIANYAPLFEIKTDTVEKCQQRCIRDPLCSGITYNYDVQNCVGTEEGVMRDETDNFIAWVKPKEPKEYDTNLGIIMSYTSKPKYVSNNVLMPPNIMGDFCYSFYVTIFDFYENFGSWRHVFHKGSSMIEPEGSGYQLDYQNWENVVTDYPEQSIGVWLAPFTNNLRIAYTTISNQNVKVGSHLHAFIQKCNDLTNDCYITDSVTGKHTNVNMIGDGSDVPPKLTKKVEYIDQDIQNIPINKPVHISLNFRVSNVELYIDGNLKKIVNLDGTPDFNDGDLYVMYPKSFNGQVSKLTYIPQSVNRNKIMKMKGSVPKFN